MDELAALFSFSENSPVVKVKAKTLLSLTIATLLGDITLIRKFWVSIVLIAASEWISGMYKLVATMVLLRRHLQCLGWKGSRVGCRRGTKGTC